MEDILVQSAAASDAAGHPDVSIIVPTINEAENLPVLLERIAAALAGASWEVLIVDDNSRDATPRVCAQLAQRYPLKLLVRAKPANGLSGAVLHGMAAAGGKFLCVMDADLQHPPERLAALLEPLRSGEADFVLGSRYMPGGSTDDEWGIFRKFNSQLATLLARPFAGRTTDPMAGFFALKRESYAAATNLTPLGYKIALELMCKCRVKTVKEIPIHFGMRQRGESKLSLKQQFRYLEHLSRLYDFKYPRASPIVKFFIATAASWLVGLGMYLPLIRAGDGQDHAIALAYLPAIAVTAIFHVRYVRTQREFLSRQTPWLDFAVISVAEWIVAMVSAWWIARRVTEPGTWETFVVCFGLATLTRYVLRKEFLLDIRGLRRTLPREAESKPRSAD
ncbi:MAG: polyprenol monophosphomannose synthase [Tepidisphaeraceae bacterium]